MDDDSASEIYEVEKIVGLRKKGRALQFYVRWKGYSSEYDSWEPMKNLDGCTDLVEEFVQLNPEYRSMVPGFIPKPVPAKRKRRQDSEQSQADNSTPAQSPEPEAKRIRPPTTLKVTGDSEHPDRVVTLSKHATLTSAKTCSLQLSPGQSLSQADNKKTGRNSDSSPSRKLRSCQSPKAASVLPTPSGSSNLQIPLEASNVVQVPTTSTSGQQATANDTQPERQRDLAHRCQGGTTSKQVAGRQESKVKQTNPHVSVKSKTPASPATTPTMPAKAGVLEASRPEASAAPKERYTTVLVTSGKLEIDSRMNLSSEEIAARKTPMTDKKAAALLPTLKSPVCDAGGITSVKTAAGSGNGRDTPNKSTDKLTCGLTPLSLQPMASGALTPAGKDVITNCEAPLWKPLTSTGEETYAMLTVDVVQQQGSLRQPHAAGPDPFTEKWVKSLVGVELLSHEDTISTISRNAQQAESPAGTPVGATSRTLSNMEAKLTPSTVGCSPAANLPAKAASTVATNDAKPDRNESDNPPDVTTNDKKADVTASGKKPNVNAKDIKPETTAGTTQLAAKEDSSLDCSSEELDLPFGTTLPAKADVQVDFEFDDYQEESDSSVPVKNMSSPTPVDLTPDVLTSAAMEGNCSIFRRAIQSKVNLDMADSRSATPISVAVQYGQEEVVQMLLESPININLTMATGETLLMVAAQRNRHGICTKLIRAGAHLNSQALPSNETALIMACKRDHVKTVEVLLRAGCDLAVADAQGATALDHVMRLPCSSLESRLKKHSTRMTEYLFNAVSQRVQSEGAPTVPAVVGFRSFGSSFQTVYNIAFKHELTDASRDIRLFLLRGRLKQDSAGMRLSWAGPGLVAEVIFNKVEVTAQVRHNMYRLAPVQGRNEITIRLSSSGGSQQGLAFSLDRIFACVYDIKKNK